MGKMAPIIGNWYRDSEQQALFEVVAIDDHSGAIEIQYASGDLDEIEQEDWADGSYQAAPPPEETDEEVQEEEADDVKDDSALWGLHLNDMDLQGFDTLDWKEPLR